MFITPSGDGAKYAKCDPSGDNNGEVFSGFPNNISRGISSSDVVRLPPAPAVVSVVESCIGARARFCVRREVVATVEKAVTPPPPAAQPARMAAMKGATTLVGSIIGVLLVLGSCNELRQ
jgi:hypothetical protein